MYEADQSRRAALQLTGNGEGAVPAVMTRSRQIDLLMFAGATLFLVSGVLAFGWFITEIAALFLEVEITCGCGGRLTFHHMTTSFRKEAEGMIGVALIIRWARGILVVARDGKILDAMLFSLSGITTHVRSVFAAHAMFLAQRVINFFVYSGSGLAALTMPIMAPLANAVGITRQTAVLAFQFGEGWINPILRTPRTP